MFRRFEHSPDRSPRQLGSVHPMSSRHYAERLLARHVKHGNRSFSGVASSSPMYSKPSRPAPVVPDALSEVGSNSTSPASVNNSFKLATESPNADGKENAIEESFSLASHGVDSKYGLTTPPQNSGMLRRPTPKSALAKSTTTARDLDEIESKRSPDSHAVSGLKMEEEAEVQEKQSPVQVGVTPSPRVVHAPQAHLHVSPHVSPASSQLLHTTLSNPGVSPAVSPGVSPASSCASAYSFAQPSVTSSALTAHRSKVLASPRVQAVVHLEQCLEDLHASLTSPEASMHASPARGLPVMRESPAVVAAVERRSSMAKRRLLDAEYQEYRARMEIEELQDEVQNLKHELLLSNAMTVDAAEMRFGVASPHAHSHSFSHNPSQTLDVSSRSHLGVDQAVSMCISPASGLFSDDSLGLSRAPICDCSSQLSLEIAKKSQLEEQLLEVGLAAQSSQEDATQLRLQLSTANMHNAELQTKISSLETKLADIKAKEEDLCVETISCQTDDVEFAKPVRKLDPRAIYVIVWLISMLAYSIVQFATEGEWLGFRPS